MMKLNLKKPLAFFDLEATGLNVGSDRIVEIAILKAMPDGTEQLFTKRINPEIPIPLVSSLIHGIYDKDVINQPTFTQIAKEVADFIADADLAGYNSNKFDIPMLLEEFLRANINFEMTHRKFVDVQNIFHQMEQRTLKAAYKFYCNKEIINAHSAEADIRATYEVLLAQLDKYKDVEFEDKQGQKSKPVINDIDTLHAFTNLHKQVDFAGRIVFNENDEETINFGKHKGKTVENIFDIEPSYYSWMMQGDFPLYTKYKMKEIWERWNAKKAANKPPKAPAEKNKTDKPADKSMASKPAEPLNNEMLEQLKIKFGKQ